MSQLAFDFRLRPGSRFDNFEGDAKQPLEAQLAGARDCQAIYVVGPPGSGKSHLLEAACAARVERGDSAVYLSGLTAHEPDLFDGLESLAHVSIDGVDRLTGNRAWEVALFHLINGLRDSGGTIAFAAERPAAALLPTLADLGSRLLAALPVQTHEPGDTDRARILKVRAAEEGVELGDDVVRYILHRSDRNMGVLVAALDELLALNLREGRRLTIPFVREKLGW